jgi:uncharacterized protein with ParB-like and HNH nuclease domain
MRKKEIKNLELENEEKEIGFSAIHTRLNLLPIPRKLRDVFREYKEGNINLQPDFQREFVWKKQKQEELIKSIWRGIPLPMFYFSKGDIKSEVIDGQQRLTTIFGYLDPESIKDKKVRNSLIKKVRIHDENKNPISREEIIRKIKEDMDIWCVEIQEKGLNANDKFEIFRSLNLGATPLKIQEIRNAIFQKEIPHLNKALKSGAKKIEKLTGMKNSRMILEDLVLRFLIIQEKGYDKRVSDQMKNNVELKNLFTEEKVKYLSIKFNRFIIYMNRVFGKKSFQVLLKNNEHNSIPDKEWEMYSFSGKINQGLFHLFSYYLPKPSSNILNSCSHKKVKENFISLIKNKRFLNLITGSGTDRTKNIRESSKLFEELFMKKCFGDWDKIEKRNLSRQEKQTILENIPYCYLCYGEIKRIEYLENFRNLPGEHIKPFSKGKKGSKSTFRNILLAHKKCNSEKSSMSLEEYRKSDKSIKKRIKNKCNIKQYLNCLKKWNKYHPLQSYKKLIKYAREDKRLK